MRAMQNTRGVHGGHKLTAGLGLYQDDGEERWQGQEDL